MVEYIQVEDVEVPHMFLKKHVTFLLDEDRNFSDFYEQFQKYFLNSILTPQAHKYMEDFLSGKTINQKEKQYLINTLKRVFSNHQHFKGLVGEHVFAFYYSILVKDLVWAHGPKGRSSAEPGIDYVTFTGNSQNKNELKVIVWETKTTEKAISSRANQIYDFFSENGSLDENIDNEIYTLTEIFANKPESALKEVVSDLFSMFINKDENFCIGASAVSSNFSTTEDTFKGFSECYKNDLGKEQRIVEFIFIKLLDDIMNNLRDNIWYQLQK